jgi:hypothetical protein
LERFRATVRTGNDPTCDVQVNIEISDTADDCWSGVITSGQELPRWRPHERVTVTLSNGWVAIAEVGSAQPGDDPASARVTGIVAF